MANMLAIDTAIALGGVSLGLVMGSLNSIRRTGSLFGVSHHEPKHVSLIVKYLGVERERRFAEFNHKDKNPLIPGVWHPFMPLEQLLPLTVVVVSQLGMAALSPNATAKSIATLGATYTLKLIVLPVAYSFVVCMGGSLLREYSRSYTRKMGIDCSGHALMQAKSPIHKVIALWALSSLGISSNLYRATAAVTTLSDCLWTYRTTSSHHSTMDMVVTGVFMGISFGTLYMGHCALISYAPKMIGLFIK